MKRKRATDKMHYLFLKTSKRKALRYWRSECILAGFNQYERIFSYLLPVE